MAGWLTKHATMKTLVPFILFNRPDANRRVFAEMRAARPSRFDIVRHIWGRASWSRTWTDYDVELKQWPACRDARESRNVAPHDPPFACYPRCA